MEVVYMTTHEAEEIKQIRKKPKLWLTAMERELIKTPFYAIPCCVPIYYVFQAALLACLWPIYIIAFVLRAWATM